MKTQTVQLIRSLCQKEILELPILCIVVIIQKSQCTERPTQIPTVPSAGLGVCPKDGTRPEFRRLEEDEGRDTRYGTVQETECRGSMTGCGEELLCGVGGGGTPTEWRRRGLLLIGDDIIVTCRRFVSKSTADRWAKSA